MDENKKTTTSQIVMTPLLFTTAPNWLNVFAKVLVTIILFSLLILIITPWQQTSQGKGKVIALNPSDRTQSITSAVRGKIEKWFVYEGSKVKAGDPVVEIVDNDPNLVERLKLERDAILKKYEAAKIVTETSYRNLKRQKELFDQGLSSRVKYENAKIKYKKLLASEASAAAYLAKAEVRLSRQKSQLVRAPKDGTILRILHGSGSIFVKDGDTLATFVPETSSPAVELFINGNDLPLVEPGRHVRLQFEGWPAVQFSGWPSVAVGTFGGVVSIIDPSISSNGNFRVIVIPDGKDDWPDNSYLRQGVRVYGWVLLDTVRLGYELWRQFNGFPPSIDQTKDSSKPKKDSSKLKKDKYDDPYKDLYKNEDDY